MVTNGNELAALGSCFKADIADTKNAEIVFCNNKGKEIGKLKFEDTLKFEGDLDESSQIFIDFVLKSFNNIIERDYVKR